MKFHFLVLLIACVSCASKVQVYWPSSGKTGTYKELISGLPKKGHIVLGEFHYDKDIQKMEAMLIRDIAHSEQKMALGWEFLDTTDQDKIDSLSDKFKGGSLSAAEFLKNFFSEGAPTYIPLVETLKEKDIHLIGLNVPRKFRQQLIKEGIHSLPEGIVPPNMKPGDEKDFKRFSETMKNHVPEEKVLSYFEAQSLSDAKMSYVLSKTGTELNVSVLGAFHTDYFGGIVARLKELITSPVTVIKIINKDKLKTTEISDIKEVHPEYGPIADAIVILN